MNLENELSTFLKEHENMRAEIKRLEHDLALYAGWLKVALKDGPMTRTFQEAKKAQEDDRILVFGAFELTLEHINPPRFR